MDPVQIYRRCVEAANRKTEEFFGHGPYEPGSEAHDFWLKRFDEAYSS